MHRLENIFDAKLKIFLTQRIYISLWLYLRFPISWIFTAVFWIVTPSGAVGNHTLKVYTTLHKYLPVRLRHADRNKSPCSLFEECAKLSYNRRLYLPCHIFISEITEQILIKFENYVGGGVGGHVLYI